MKIQQLTAADAIESVHSSPTGLAQREATRRLGEFGPNELPRVPGEPLVLTFAKEFVHFFAIILWIAAALAFFAEIRQPGEGMRTLGFAIVGVIIINGVFSFWQAFRAERAIEALQQLLPDRAKVLRDGAAHQVLRTELVPGDIIFLEAGDNVAADCRVLEGFALRVNDAAITGESVPRSRGAERCESDAVMTSRNIVLAGTSIVSGEGKALVFGTGLHTEFGKIAHLTQTAGEELAPLQKEIVRLSHLIAALALVIGVVFLHRARDWTAFLGQLLLRDRHHRCERAGRVAPDGDARARPGFAANGETQRTHPPFACRRNARIDHRHLHRQDRHIDGEQNGRAPALHRQCALSA
jgi:magnesium-transporting ATPase (P-type)